MSNDKGNNLYSNPPMLTAIEISEKINELLDKMEYNNSEMLLTKEHIKSNLTQLINLSKNRFGSLQSNRNRKQKIRSSFSNKFFVDNRGKLKADFSFHGI